uniref:ORF4 protein n=1 Tax=Vibrio cholerae TaxID=666 RepID=Q6TE17_VIBCL|nr:ORF4 protein [Vibrio cholerae]
MQNFPPAALRGCADLHNLPPILRGYRSVRVFGVWVTPMEDTDKMLNALYRFFVSTGRYIIKKLSLFNGLASLLSLELDAPFSMRLI